MQNARINRFGIDLSAIKPYPDNPAYVQQVVTHLRDTKQNLSTKDLAVLFSDDLGMSFRAMGMSFRATYANSFEIDYLTQISNLHGLYNINDVYNIQRLICDNLPAAIGIEDYHQNLITIKIDLPSQSILNPKKLAVWRNTSKMGNIQTRQVVSVRKWIGSTLVGLTDEQAENLAFKIDELLQGTILTNLDVRHHSSYDFDAWERAYTSEKISSCMNTSSDSEVGRYRTFTCYCSGYHGLPDNGLKLTVLYQNDTPVARAITFCDDDERNYYIRAYGDDRLERWLIEKGYERAAFADGTILYTTERLLKPYVDGDVTMADYYTTDDGKHYWVLDTNGGYDLQTTQAYATHAIECECCGSYRTDETQVVLSHVNHEYYTVCDSCLDNNSYGVYTGSEDAESLFFHDGYSPDTNSEYVQYDREYYETDSLGAYDLRLIDDEVYHEDDLYRCDRTDEYFTDGEDVYTDAEQISTDQPVHFPYYCINREYWNENVVETTCGTLALSGDTRDISTPSLGKVCTLDDYWTIYNRQDGAGVSLVGIIFKLADIERDYEWEPSDKMQAFRDYAIAFNKIQYLRFQELGI